MNNKILIPIFIFLIICGFLTIELAEGNMEEILFDAIPYNYTSYVSIPSTGNSGTLGGYYQIFGKGTDFNFKIVLSGAENYEDPLDYIQDGLNGKGKVTSIEITYETISDLLSRNFKKAMLDTKFSGTFNMTCAAWTGYGNFSNDGKNFTGNFVINGTLNDWEGKFYLVPNGNRIDVPTNYIAYPHGNKAPGTITYINKTYFM
ncbi:hypothetical protein [Methanobacterium sp.]|uniref:hypothetical protein n=1 Tax=Methanobacterium sp. TaxID=2164 RepID=UPI003C791A5C